jgi:hypothetical protein
MESNLLSTLHVQRVVVFLYAGSRRLLHNLTDMRQKPSAGLGLRVAMVPESYQRTLGNLIGYTKSRQVWA